MIRLLGHCSCCGLAVPAMEAREHPGRVRLDYHRHPVPGWWLCIGSRSVMRRYSDYRAGGAIRKSASGGTRAG